MGIQPHQQQSLQKLPGVDRILEWSQDEPQLKGIPKSVLLASIRSVLQSLRDKIIREDFVVADADKYKQKLFQMIIQVAKEMATPKLKQVVNATGIVIHTNLGRSPLAEHALSNMADISSGYSNLEFDLANGKRGSRYAAVEDILCELSGAEAGLVVNNNAGAVLLCLESMARNQEVIVSRGELVEIGGSFRIPDIMAKSGGILKEVGTTNRTHLRDYKNAIGLETALLLKVHTSNYSVVGFTKSVALGDLVKLGHAHDIPVMEDLGSGMFIDFSRYGLPHEPTVQETIKTDVDLITFSGDKLLGGPQAGIILGKRKIIDRIKRNPLTRALRIDKMTLAALESTLHLYRDESGAIENIPTLHMLTLDEKILTQRAESLGKKLKALNHPSLFVNILKRNSKAGGGSLPQLDLPSQCVGIRMKDLSINALEKMLRKNHPPIIGRIGKEQFLMDIRTLQTGDINSIVAAITHILKNHG